MDDSYLSSEGCHPFQRQPSWMKDNKVVDIKTLEFRLNELFSEKDMSWTDRHNAILYVLERVDLSTNEVNKFTFWDPEKAYTRNLIARDPAFKHYTLLLLCWNAGKESKIHNHPCDGCFIKTIRGCIKETRYHLDQDTLQIKVGKVKFFNEGQISYMDDNLGYHKIGNSQKDTGAVSLHLYTPPFSECKVWSSEGYHVDDYEIGKIGFYSVFGNRSPHLEGKPGAHSRLLREIQYFNSSKMLRKIVEINE